LVINYNFFFAFDDNQISLTLLKLQLAGQLASANSTLRDTHGCVDGTPQLASANWVGTLRDTHGTVVRKKNNKKNKKST
jgi:hypothetical protein